MEVIIPAYVVVLTICCIVSIPCAIEWKDRHKDAPHVGYLIGGLLMISIVWPLSLLGFFCVTAKKGFMYWYRQLIPRRYEHAPPDGPPPKSGPHR